ncbi:MAG: thiosulfate oxidation carrier protein SoxY, partial [Candidatus Thiothrix moscowensis]|nr:thiosulfate oxidation carrier protein SoxY [Candidatus Thiothrix moscowensis]MBJ6611927.1 thiosulfate oxidation carrier protein SoxY [Candidatus Thiothrix moscowensis]
MKRRTFLQGTLAASAAGLAVSAGLLTPRAVMAANPAFEAKTLADALSGIGAGSAAESGDVKIKAPEIAE